MTTPTPPITLRYTGNYSLAASVTLAASAAFVEGLRNGAAGEPVLDLAFPLEGSWHSVGVRVNQQNGEVHAHIFANPGPAATDDIRTALERMLSLDVDGAGFAHVVARDEVVAGLVKKQPGVRLGSSPQDNSCLVKWQALTVRERFGNG